MTLEVGTLARAITEEALLAEAFLRTLTDERQPWNDLFTAWARERGLSEGLARSVKVTVIRLRTFGAIERHARRRRRR